MFSNVVYNVKSTEFLLFDKDDGICCRINKLDIADLEELKTEFVSLDKLLMSENLPLEYNFMQITEKFIDWGCNFVLEMIRKNSLIIYAKDVMKYIDYLYGILPMSSNYLKKTLITSEKIIILFTQFRKNFTDYPNEYMYIFTKFLSFCEEEIKEENVIIPALVIVYELLISPFANSFIYQIFEFADMILTKYNFQLGCKINDKLIVHHLLNIIKIVVRNECHAICRLHFWWKFICSLDGNLMCTDLFKSCVIPFLANMFGKYISYSDEKFPYSLSKYNCLNNYSDIGLLCNHVMSQLLSVVGVSPLVSEFDNSLKFGTIEHWIPHKNILFTEENLKHLLISFSFWSQLLNINTSKNSFNVWELVIKCFTDTFIIDCQINQENTLDDNNKSNKISTFYYIIDEILILKRKDESLRKQERLTHQTFNDNLKVMKILIDHLEVLNDRKIWICASSRFLLKVLCEHLSDMNQFVISNDISIDVKNISEEWLESCKSIINITFSKNIGFTMIMVEDLDMINKHWFNGWFDKGSKVSMSKDIGIVNFQCWFYLSSMLGHILYKDSLTVYCTDEFQIQLTPFIDYLIAPIFIMMELGDDVLTKSDYNEIWKVWEHTYIDLVTKSQLIPDFSYTSWTKSIIKLLKRMLKRLREKESILSLKYTLIFNIIFRCIRLVLCRTESDINSEKKNHFWSLFRSLCKNFPNFSTDNLKINFKNNFNGMFILHNLCLTSSSRWARFKFSSSEKLKCNPESNLDLFLSVLNILISMIAESVEDFFKILDMMENNFISLSSSILSRNLNNKFNNRLSRQRNTYDENSVYIEKFIIQFLNRYQVICFKKNISSEIVQKISPILIHIFTFEGGILTRSTMQSVIRFWNDIVKCEGADNFTYSDSLVKIFKKLKMTNKMIEVPKIMLLRFKELEDESFELIHKESVETGEEKLPKSVFGSMLHKINGNYNKVQKVSMPIEVVRNAAETSTKEILKISNSTPIKNIECNNNMCTPQKELNSNVDNKPKQFSSPKPKIESRANRKRSFFEISRKSSDVDYVVIEPIKEKRIRLTEHQKDNFLEKQQQYKPDLANEVDFIPKFTLNTQESMATTISIDSSCSILVDADIVENTEGLDKHLQSNYSSSEMEIKNQITLNETDSALNENNKNQSVNIQTHYNMISDHIDDASISFFKSAKDITKSQVSLTEINPITIGNKEEKSVSILGIESQSNCIIESNGKDQQNLTCLKSEMEVTTNLVLPIEICPVTNKNIEKKYTNLLMIESHSNCNIEFENRNESESQIIKSEAGVRTILIDSIKDGDKENEFLIDRKSLIKNPNIDMDKHTLLNTHQKHICPTMSPTVVLDRFVVDKNYSNALINKKIDSFQRSPIVTRFTQSCNGSKKAFSPLNSGYVRSPIANSTSQRTQRLVQLAIENQAKKIPRSEVKNVSEQPHKNTGIIRNFWSDRKKDVRVSFSLPPDDSENATLKDSLKEVPIDPFVKIGIPITVEDGMKSCISFMSPVPTSNSELKPLIPEEICLDLNKSLSEEDQTNKSIEETKNCLQDVLITLSPTKKPEILTFENILNSLQILFKTSDSKERKKMIKELMSFIQEQI